MSENIYDILAKFPKDLPSSVKEVEPLYESVDPQNGLLESVRNLEEKFYKYKTDSKQENDPSGFKIAKAKREMQLAMAEYPEASSPEEAIVARMGDQAEETKQVIDNAKATIAKQQQEISKTAQAVNDANDRYNAQEQRFQEFNKQVAASNLDVKQQAQAALAFAKQPQAQPQDIIAQTQATTPAQTAPTAEPTAEPKEPEQAMPELPTQEKPAEKPAPTNVVDMDAERKKRAQQQAKLAQQLSSLPTQVPKIANLEEAVGNNPNLAINNWTELQKTAEADPPPAYTNLKFADDPTPLTLRHYDAIAIYKYLLVKSLRNKQYDEVMLTKLIRSTLNDKKTVNHLLKTQELSNLRTVVKKLETQRLKAQQTKLDYNAPKTATQAPAQQPQQPAQPGLKGTEFYKYITRPPQQRDLFRTDDMQENIKTNSILEGVRQVEDKKLKEAAKPDFLDLDKDGDTDEPMKKAAKDAKDHEPAKPDSDAVAKRKRLQALKDKQEDERAEKGDDYKSASRFVKGRAYGGSAQKDDEDKDELDEGAKPDFLDVDKDGNKKEPFKKAVKDKKEVEEGIKFGDTIKNSKGKMTKVTVKEGKDAIRNHPIYTTKEAWDHYAEELAEQEMMEQSVLTPVVNVQQELDEIAKLAGLPVKTCESCGCAESACKCNENLAPMAPSDSASPLTHTLEEAATRKDFRQCADTIKDIEDLEKRKEHALHYADFFKEQNPRFKREMFLAACHVDLAECGSMPSAVIVGEGDTCPTCDCAPCKCDESMMEDEMEEGNEFSGALAAAKASGAKDFEVDGKKYTVKEDINVNVSANGEEDVVNLIRKLSGMPVIAIQATQAEEACGACGSSPCGCETVAEDGPKERDVEYTNSPREETAGLDASIPSGDGDDRAKKMYSKEYMGDNHMAESKEDNLWQTYEDMINDVKA